MADTISSQSFISLKGEMHAPGTMVEEISRPGVDYHAFRRMAVKAEPSKLVGFRDAASASAAHTLRTTYAALMGTVVTIVQQGISYPNMLILEAQVKEIVPLAKAVGGLAAGTWGVTAEFTVIYAGNT